MVPSVPASTCLTGGWYSGTRKTRTVGTSPAKTVERLGRKGYLVTDIDLGSEPVTLVNLHLYSARKEREKIHTNTTRADRSRSTNGDRRRSDDTR